MSGFARFHGWFLVALLFAGSFAHANAGASREALVIGQGAALAAFSGNDQGQGEPGLRLTSMGRWHDDRGVQRYTIWRVRNTGATSRTVRLDAPGSGFAITPILPSRTELFLRSPVTSGEATHRLFEGATQVDVKAAGDTAWTDATPVVPATGANHAPVILSVPDPMNRSRSAAHA